jgi:hypothetical protein
MRTRVAAVATVLTLVGAGSAQAQQPVGPYAPWDGTNPFNCTIQDVGTGTAFPDPAADPFCVEFDKTQQNITDLGILDFLLNEPVRVAAATPKCFYYQSDHWTGSIVQGEAPELWHWDGQYFFDKAIGAGGVNLQNFRILGQPASLPEGSVPPQLAPYFDQGGGGAYVVTGIPADPACAARVDTPAEQAQVYAGAPPPPPPGDSGSGSGSLATGPVAWVVRKAKKCKKRGKPAAAARRKCGKKLR